MPLRTGEIPLDNDSESEGGGGCDKSDEVFDGDIKLCWIGSRTGTKTPFTIKRSTIVSDFMGYVFNNFHGNRDIDEGYLTEKEYTESHNIKLIPSNKILDRDTTFGDNGVVPHDIPYDITFVVGLSGGGTRV